MTRDSKIEDAKPGDCIPPLTTGPITRLTLALFAGASGDHNPIHIDLDYAREAGMSDVFAHGMLTMAFLGRVLTNWAPQKSLRRFAVRFTAITNVHEALSCTARLVERIEHGSETLFRLELSATNEKGETKATGEAIIAIP